MRKDLLPDSRAGPRLGRNRPTERAGVRAVVDFFERNNCIVQPVNGENDFGKDLYVDLTREHTVTGATFAIQVKAGRSYRTASGYAIPIDNHYYCWRNSTVPVLGIIHDPDSGSLYWTHITRHLRESSEPTKSIPVDAANELTAASIRELQAFGDASPTSPAHSPPPFGRLWESESSLARDAVWDCFALGRHDFRYLLALRASLAFLAPEVRESALMALGHLTSHPDIYWGKHNWVPAETKELVRPCLRWTADEIACFVAAAGAEWERGTLGQTVTLLLREDPDVTTTCLVSPPTSEGSSSTEITGIQ